MSDKLPKSPKKHVYLDLTPYQDGEQPAQGEPTMSNVMYEEPQPKCELCGQPMPLGEEMFKYHGHSGPCPKPRREQPAQLSPQADAEMARRMDEYQAGEQPAQGEPNTNEILACGCLRNCKGHAAQAMSQAGLQAHVYSAECPTCGSKRRDIRLCPLCHINAKGHRFEDHPTCDDNDWHNFKSAGAVEGVSAEQSWQNAAAFFDTYAELMSEGSGPKYWFKFAEAYAAKLREERDALKRDCAVWKAQCLRVEQELKKRTGHD